MIVAMNFLKNFTARDLISDDKGAPVKGSAFDRWNNGDEPKIDEMFLDYAWGALYESLKFFCADKNDEFFKNPKDISRLEECIKATAMMIPKASLEISPLDFYAYLMDFTIPGNMGYELKFSGLQMMAAFLIISLDEAITSLLNNDTKLSARYALFIGVTISIIQMSKESDHRAHARKIALRLHENSPKRKEKELIYSRWKDWQKKTYQYDGKAEFAREMLNISKHLTSQKVIEDWCRVWEKEIGTLPA